MDIRAIDPIWLVYLFNFLYLVLSRFIQKIKHTQYYIFIFSSTFIIINIWSDIRTLFVKFLCMQETHHIVLCFSVGNRKHYFIYLFFQTTDPKMFIFTTCTRSPNGGSTEALSIFHETPHALPDAKRFANRFWNLIIHRVYKGDLF